MNDETRPKREIINEIAGMRQRFYQMESSIKKFKETEKELKKEKIYLENIIESSIDPIITTDGKGYIKRFNKSFLELLACNVRDVKGKHMAELGPPEVGTYESVTGESVYIDNEFFDKIKEMAATFIKGGKITNREIYLIRKDKKIVPI